MQGHERNKSIPIVVCYRHRGSAEQISPQMQPTELMAQSVPMLSSRMTKRGSKISKGIVRYGLELRSTHVQFVAR